jgi:anti-sigma factor RsiW
MVKECACWQEIIPEYLAGELGPEEARALRAHLEGCPVCRQELQNWQGTFALLDLPPEDPGPDFTARVMAALEKELTKNQERVMPPAPATRVDELSGARPSLPSGQPSWRAFPVLTGLGLAFCLAIVGALILKGLLLAGGRFPWLDRGVDIVLEGTISFLQEVVTVAMVAGQGYFAGLIQLLAGVIAALGEKAFLLWVLGDALVTLLQSVPPAIWTALMAPGLVAGVVLGMMLKPHAYR